MVGSGNGRLTGLRLERLPIAEGGRPPWTPDQNAVSGRSITPRSVASAIVRSADNFGSTVRANHRAEATLPS